MSGHSPSLHCGFSSPTLQSASAAPSPLSQLSQSGSFRSQPFAYAAELGSPPGRQEVEAAPIALALYSEDRFGSQPWHSKNSALTCSSIPSADSTPSGQRGMAEQGRSTVVPTQLHSHNPKYSPFT